MLCCLGMCLQAYQGRQLKGLWERHWFQQHCVMRKLGTGHRCTHTRSCSRQTRQRPCGSSALPCLPSQHRNLTLFLPSAGVPRAADPRHFQVHANLACSLLPAQPTCVRPACSLLVQAYQELQTTDKAKDMREQQLLRSQMELAYKTGDRKTVGGKRHVLFCWALVGQLEMELACKAGDRKTVGAQQAVVECCLRGAVGMQRWSWPAKRAAARWWVGFGCLPGGGGEHNSACSWLAGSEGCRQHVAWHQPLAAPCCVCVCVCVGTARPDAHSSNSCLTCTHLNSASTGGEAGGAAGAHRPGRPEQAGAPARLGHLKPLAYSPFQQLRHDTSCGRAAETVRAWRQPQRQLFMHHLSGWQLAAALQLAPGCPACLVDATLTYRCCL